MMKTSLALTLLAVVAAQAGRGCRCNKPVFVNSVDINVDDLPAKALNIMENVYQNATHVINLVGESVGLEVDVALFDQYNVDPEEPCFLASLRLAQLSQGDNSASIIRVDLKGQAFEDRIETSLCNCRPIGFFNRDWDVCAVLGDAIEARQADIKCALENNCA